MNTTTDAPRVPNLPSSFFGQAFLTDPYPHYQQLRAMGPVVRMVDRDSYAWVFSHHEDIARIQRDARFLSKRTPLLMRLIPAEHRHEFARLASIIDMWMVCHDGEKHLRMRKIINRGFSSLAIQKQRADIEAVVDLLIGRLEGRHSCEFVKEFAHPFPATVIMRILGVPREDLDQCMVWSDELVNFAGGIRQIDLPTVRGAQQALENMMGLFGALVAARRAEGQDDLISYLIEAQDKEGDALMSDEEMAAQCCLLLLNGNETTRNLLSSSLYLLFQHPEQLALLRADPELMEKVVEEVLRFESPSQFIRRVAAADFEYCGAQLREGDSVLLLLGSANHDDARYAQPQRFDILREDGKHMSFGHGPHLCVGAGLTRIEAKIALSRLFERLPELRQDATPAVWNMNPAFRGLAQLHLLF